MRIQVGARSDVGRVRSNNEDSFKVVPELNLFVLSDGMGGEAHGEEASHLAVEAVASHCLEGSSKPNVPYLVDPRPELDEKTNRLASAVQLANRMIYESAQKHAAQRGMGATVVAIWINDQRLSVAHVGDSRAYLIAHGSQIEALTRDHSLVNRLVELGQITTDEAAVHPQRNVLYRALGQGEPFDPDVNSIQMPESGYLLLCSDGLWSVVSESDLQRLVKESGSPEEACHRMVEAANAAGGPDNISAILIRLPG